MKKKTSSSLHFTSLDIVVYSLVIFTSGIMVGLAFGRFKHARFYFAGKRIDKLVGDTQRLVRITQEVKKNVTDILLPGVEILKKRAPDYGCTNSNRKFTFARQFAGTPDVLFNMGGISLDLKDATVSSKTMWLAKVESAVTETTVDVSNILPSNKVINTCWIALPNSNTP